MNISAILILCFLLITVTVRIELLRATSALCTVIIIVFVG